MVGAFPPPVHGMAAINAAVRDALRQAGVTATVIDLAAPSLDRSMAARLGRLPRVLRGLGRLASQSALRGGTLYMSVSGGLGQVYELAFLLLARLRGMRVFLHHHSFAYLDEPTWVTQALVKSAGSRAVHMTQSRGMAQRLQALYGADNVVPISNAVLHPRLTGTARCRMAVRKLGFLSNLSAEKGVFEFLDLMAAAASAGLPITGVLAGACQDQNTRDRLEQYLRSLHNVSYVGAVYGADKEQFLDAIDVLVFPTRYRNETEGIVNHEAMSRGIPVIAYGRGCIPEIVGTDCGLVIDPAEPFVPAALAKLESWLADPVAFQAASQASAARFARTYDENAARWRALLEDIVGAHPGGEPRQGVES
jgi:glycosyltransferase involved in cell wall biosynthesis